MSQEITVSHLLCLASCLSQGYAQFTTREIWYWNSKSHVPDSETLVTEGGTQHKRTADGGN
jgi:hypothetical protein